MIFIYDEVCSTGSRRNERLETHENNAIVSANINVI